jgi:hypothetical protein
LSRKHGTTEGLAKLRSGQEVYEEVARACSSPGGLTEENHKKLREALATLRSAMNWLEDTEQFDAAHDALDKAGNLARRAFPRGCLFPYRDGTYFVECPVALAHNRVGMSPGFVARTVECSICGRDPDECPHISGRIYDGQRCVRNVTDLDLLEISLVARPKQPDARIESMSIDVKDLRDSLGEEFAPGVPVTCDRCLSACDGVARPFEELPAQYLDGE